MGAKRRVQPKVYNGTDYDTLEYQTVAEAVKAAAGSADQDAQAHIDNPARHVTAAEKATWNGKLAGSPNGADPLISGDKINTKYLPDSLLGQVMYSGTISKAGVATLNEAFKSKYGKTEATLTLAAADAAKYPGSYFIAQDTATFTDQTVIGVAKVSTGDWILSNGASGWTKIDNSDAVTGLKGNAESTYRTGNVNLTPANIGAEPAFTKKTAFNKDFGTAAPSADGVASAGSADTVARSDHRHPTDTTRASTAVATQSVNGLMSAADKKKLDTMSGGVKIVMNSAQPTGLSTGDIWIQEL